LSHHGLTSRNITGLGVTHKHPPSLSARSTARLCSTRSAAIASAASRDAVASP